MLGLAIGLVIVYPFVSQRTNVSAVEESGGNEDDERTTDKKSIRKIRASTLSYFGRWLRDERGGQQHGLS